MSLLDSITNNANLLQNIANNLMPVQTMIRGFAYVMGISFALKAIYTLKMYGEARTMMSGNTDVKGPLIYFLVAAVFLYFPTAMSVMLNSTFGSSNVLEYQAITSQSNVISTLFGSDYIGRPLTIIIQTVGLVAFVRGWVLIARSASQGQPPGGAGKGLVHVFGGIFAMNIVATLEIVNNTIFGLGQ